MNNVDIGKRIKARTYNQEYIIDASHLNPTGAMSRYIRSRIGLRPRRTTFQSRGRRFVATHTCKGVSQL